MDRLEARGIAPLDDAYQMTHWRNIFFTLGSVAPQDLDCPAAM
jgi:hypothetical protein